MRNQNSSFSLIQIVCLKMITVTVEFLIFSILTISMLKVFGEYQARPFRMVYNNTFLDKTPLQSINTLTLVECTLICLQNKDCEAITFSMFVDIVNCYLFPNTTSITEKSKFRYSASWAYYEKDCGM